MSYSHCCYRTLPFQSKNCKQSLGWVGIFQLTFQCDLQKNNTWMGCSIIYFYYVTNSQSIWRVYKSKCSTFSLFLPYPNMNM